MIWSSTEYACVSDYTYATFTLPFAVVSGQTYYIMVADTNSGTAVLPDPLIINVTEI